MSKSRFFNLFDIRKSLLFLCLLFFGTLGVVAQVFQLEQTAVSTQSPKDINYDNNTQIYKPWSQPTLFGTENQQILKSDYGPKVPPIGGLPINDGVCFFCTLALGFVLVKTFMKMNRKKTKKRKLNWLNVYILVISNFFIISNSPAHSMNTTESYASDDYAFTEINSPVNINVLANDMYSCSPALSVTRQPKHGTTSIVTITVGSNNNVPVIKYSPDSGFVGRDTLRYIHSCSGNDAMVYIVVSDNKINIVNPDCYIDPFYRKWGIKETEQLGNVAIYDVPKVGDLDGDGYPEILVAEVVNNPSGAIQYTNQYVLYDGKTHKKIKRFKVPVTNVLWMGTSAWAKVKISEGEYKVLFFTVGYSTSTIQAFDLSTIDESSVTESTVPTITPYWSTPYTRHWNFTRVAENITIADYNNDGYAEITVSNQIFDAATGRRLIDGGTQVLHGENNTSTSVGFGILNTPADVTGSGKLNYITGNEVYDVSINTDRTSGSMTLAKKLTLPSNLITYAYGTVEQKGFTTVADINNDGRKDVVVLNTDGSSNIKLYAWDVQTQKVIASAIIPSTSNQVSSYSCTSVPFVGDIDGDGKPEIVFIAGRPFKIFAYKYVNDNTEFLQMWAIDHSDDSAGTGITLFDFNQDGIPELVYRDQTKLRIINGSLKSHVTGQDTTVYNMASITLTSQTGSEYPVIADLDNDGQAEILIGGGTSGIPQTAPLRIYKTSTFPWAPAHKVWNQYAYHVTNVNDDLSIPRFQFNSTTVFPGKDGIIGTDDDLRPFNNFLQQSTIINSEGLPFFLAADLVATTPVLSYDIKKDSIQVSLEVINHGSLHITDPWYVSTFKTTSKGDSLISVSTMQIPVDTASTQSISYYIPASLSIGAELKIKLNYNKKYIQFECDTTNNTANGVITGAFNYFACPDTEVLLEVKPITGVSYYWYRQPVGGTVVENGDNTNTLTILKKSTDSVETWFVEARYNNIAMSRHKVEVRSVPLLMYWKKTATDHNWNNPLNWVDIDDNLLYAIPRACTDIHIPGNANYYPSLDELNTPRSITAYNSGNPICNDITYHFGGEVAKPHQLTYHHAFVQYNFGVQDNDYQSKANGYQIFTNGEESHSAAPMERGRWYALSAPLKSIVTGDFNVGGYPNMFQRGFKTSRERTSDLEGEWYVPENTMVMEIGDKQNYAISIYAGKYYPNTDAYGYNDHNRLNALKGIIEIPYFENTQVSDIHRLHTYTKATATSRFGYYWYDTPGLPEEPGMYSEFKRGEEAYRFIFEDASNKPQANFKMTIPDVQATKDEVMIANPFISSFDFTQFYTENSDKIENYFRFYKEGSFVTHVAGINPPLVAPMQAFFIKPKVTGNIDLLFKETFSVLRTNGDTHQLKSGNEPENFLKVGISNIAGNSWMLLSINGKSGNNIEQLFSNDNQKVPQIYSLDIRNMKNVVQYSISDEGKILFGIRSNSTGNYELAFENTENLLLESLILIDKEQNNKQIDLLANNIYNFENVSGNLDNRFELVFKRTPSGFNKTISGATNIYTNDHMLYIESNEKIEKIEVTNIQGMTIFSEQTQDVYFFEKKLDVPAGVYIITLKQITGEIKTSKILVR